MPDRKKINIISKGRARILLAPLDWGLGHTTRCLPIINAFQAEEAEILVACNEQQAHLLKLEIPGLGILPLQGYRLSYAKSKWLTRWKLFWQIPKILTAIKRENRWLNELLEREKFDLIISDNRFGLHHPAVYSIFITHQLQISIPFSRWLEKKARAWNYHFINSFDECWIPDFQIAPNLAGKLSHVDHLPATPVKYIGILSRFVYDGNASLNQPDLVVLISGPEPQRTIFEKLIESQLQNFNGSAIVVRGMPNERIKKEGFRNILFFNHLASKELSELLRNTKLVISRSGYSSIMDLLSLQKKCILVPTPGQTEQEYLAKFLMEKKLCITFQQRDFNLKTALERAAIFEYADMSPFQKNDLSVTVHEVMRELLKETFQPDDSRQY